MEYRCIHCPNSKAFDERGIDSHYQSKHKQQKLVVWCQFCKNRFASDAEFENHKTQHHMPPANPDETSSDDSDAGTSRHSKSNNADGTVSATT